MDDIEVYDETDANALEEGDQIVWRGEYITLTAVSDEITHILIQWNDDMDIPHDEPLDPFLRVQLWEYV